MEFIPVFDTNVISTIQKWPEGERRALLRHRPRHGWQLSAITALELVAGAHNIPSARFPYLREQANIAFDLSRGRVLEDPTRLFCREVLRVAVPSHLQAPYPRTLRHYLDIIRRAESLEQILKRGVPYMGWSRGFKTTAALKRVVDKLKSDWIIETEKIATTMFPEWRQFYEQHGRRLPPEKRRALESRSAWIATERSFVRTILEWLKAPTDPATLDRAIIKLDAVLEFTTFVVREFLIGNYSVVNNASDVLDQFQLRYLAMERFAIVTDDPDLSKRTARSSQADRILTFEQFLGRL